MDRRALLLVGLLIMGIVLAQEIPAPTAISVGEPEISSADPRASEIPIEIPLPIVSAEAEAEYIEVVCAMARFHMQRFIDGMDAVKVHYDEMVSGMNTDYPDTLNLDTSTIPPLKTMMTERLNALCSATPETYGQAVQGIIDLSMGGSGMESTLKDLGNQLKTQMEAKVSDYQSQANDYQEQAKALLGGRTYEEVKPLLDQLQSKQAELIAAQATPPTSQEAGMRIQTLATEVQSLTQEIGLDESTTTQAQALAADAEAFGADAQAFGNKAEQVFGNVGEKMQAAFNQKDYSDLEATATEKQYALFLKIFEKNLVDIGGIKARLEAAGVDASALDEVTMWVNEKKEEAKSVFTADATQAEIEAWALKTQEEGMALEAKLNNLIENQVTDKWLTEFEKLRANADAGIQTAKNGGLDTTVIEEMISELESIRSEAIALKESGKREEALDKIKLAEEKIALLKQEYTRLQAQGEEARTVAENAANALEAQRPFITALINAAKEKELDTSVIENLVTELDALKTQAMEQLQAENNAEALETLNKAKELYNAVKVEYERLRGELA